MRTLLLALLFPAMAAAQAGGGADLPSPDEVPEVARELRGVWVATVENIDWPSEPGLPEAQQKQEADRLLDAAADAGLNVVIFQVRPVADALYPSQIEPWSYYLTGEQGVGVDYDPLAYWIEGAHARGLELHVWLNPFRVRHVNQKDTEPSEGSIAKQNPDAVVEYGGYLWMDPANKDAQAQTLAVVADLVDRYDLDGVHIDDYFYPYPVDDAPFPDDASYAAYREAGGDLEIGDFRRDAVNTVVKGMWDTIKDRKPHVKFGISPFGIWRPGHPASVVGFDQYDKLYADAKLWLNEGWCDYYTPQLYWTIASDGQSFPALLAWWAGENTQDRILAPGLGTYRMKERDRPLEEVVGQVHIARHTGFADGQIHFTMNTIADNVGGVADAFTERVYDEPALVPPTPWSATGQPRKPDVVVTDDGLNLTGGEKYEVWSHNGKTWTPAVLHDAEATFEMPARPVTIAIRAIDKFGRASDPVMLHVPKSN